MRFVQERLAFLHPWSESKLALMEFVTHRRLKELFLIGRNRTKRANFQGSPLFQATYNIKTNNSTHLVSVRCSEAGGRPKQTSLAKTNPSASLRASKWHEISWTDSLFLCIYVVCSLKKRTPQQFAYFVRFRPIEKCSFNLLCVLNLFPERCFRFFFFQGFCIKMSCWFYFQFRTLLLFMNT